MSDRIQYRRGNAVVSVGKPFYGRQTILGYAKLSANNFDDLIGALRDAKAAYIEANR